MINRIFLLLPMFFLTALSACERTSNSADPGIIGLAPHLAVSPNGTAVVSYIAPAESGHALQYHVISDGVWGTAQTAARGDNWFVNWADFPSIAPITDTLWAAHWLVRREAGGYAYDVHASVSDDAGQSWSRPFLLHNDGTDTEHGFVTLYPAGDEIGAIWLDGRNMSEESESGAGMTLRSGYFNTAGITGREQIVDGLTCDCCQTDVAISSAGPVAVYRDRTGDEIRDIYISRFVDGAWQQGNAVHHDGWNIAGCPVNGPVVKASGETVVVSWFTSANNEPKIKTAWSSDAGRTFSPPIVIADDNVTGYVGSALLSDQSVVVSWVCKSSEGSSSICYQQVNSDGSIDSLKNLKTQGLVARMSVPQLAIVNSQLLFVWTDKIADQSIIKSAFVPIGLN